MFRAHFALEMIWSIIIHTYVQHTLINDSLCIWHDSLTFSFFWKAIVKHMICCYIWTLELCCMSFYSIPIHCNQMAFEEIAKSHSFIIHFLHLLLFQLLPLWFLVRMNAQIEDEARANLKDVFIFVMRTCIQPTYICTYMCMNTLTNILDQLCLKQSNGRFAVFFLSC